MKAFLSSVFTGFEDFREAAAKGIESLGHEALRAENFPASIESPRVACLAGVRSSDIFVLVLGERYGELVPPKNISATHEEFREAKGRVPVLVFYQTGIQLGDDQAAFLEEVKGWNNSTYCKPFSDPDELRQAVTRALHEFELSTASTPVDATEMLAVAEALLEPKSQSYYTSSGPVLHLALVGGPNYQVLRPSEIEDPNLSREILREILLGDAAIFDPAVGTEPAVVGDELGFSQSNGNAFSMNEAGHLSFCVRIGGGERRQPILVEEDVRDLIEKVQRLSSTILELVDSSRKLARFVIATKLEGADYMSWQKRAEFDPNASSYSYGSSFAGTRSGCVHLRPPDIARASLSYDAMKNAEDLVSLLKRRSMGQ